MIKSHFVVRTYLADCLCTEDGKNICLHQELEVEFPSDAIEYAKKLKSLKEINHIMVVESAIGYTDRILYEFERSN